jgi:PIN domain nuclease of toxin-antitoxin system
VLGGVADTHALLWFALGQPNKLGHGARRIFEGVDRQDGSALVIVPTVVLHEISSHRIADKVALKSSFSQWVRSLEKNSFIQVLDVTAEMVIRSDGFQQIDDPFDRLIMGCANLLEQPLITIDEKITDSRLVETIWD